MYYFIAAICGVVYVLSLLSGEEDISYIIVSAMFFIAAEIEGLKK